MTLQADFRRRVTLVRSYLREVRKLEQSYKSMSRQSFKTQQTIAASRAAAFIMLYNCIEFGVRESIKEIRLDIQSQITDFGSLKSCWKEDITRAHFRDRVRQGMNVETLIGEIAAYPPGPLHWNGKTESLPFSGNINEDRLFSFAKKQGIRWRPRGKAIPNADIDLIRKMRNDLAHGQETFEDVGARFVADDILDKSDRIKAFILSFMQSVHTYRARQLYKEP